MKRLIFVSVIIALLLAGCGKAGPAPPTDPMIADKVITCLTELNGKALSEISTEVASLDNQIAEIERKEASFYKIRTEIDNFIKGTQEEMATREIETGLFWYYEVSEDELLAHETEYYAYGKVRLEYICTDKGWECFPDITIRDKETADTGTPESFEADLNEYKLAYENRKTAKIKDGEKAYQILSEVVKTKDAWKVNETDKGIYSVSGYGLGYTDELSSGEWYYHEFSKTIEPMSPSSAKLRDAILGKL